MFHHFPGVLGGKGMLHLWTCPKQASRLCWDLIFLLLQDTSVICDVTQLLSSFQALIEHLEMPPPLILCLALAADSLYILEFFLFRDRISRHILSLIRNKEQVSYFFEFKLPVIAWFLQHSLGVEREGAITVIKSGICFHGRQRKYSCEMFDFLF